MTNLDATLAQLESAQLVRRLAEEELAYLFKHALTQDTAYQSLLKQTRRAIHQRVAEAIERLYAERLDGFAALLAQHYAEAGDDAKMVGYAIRAGDVAVHLYAPTEARLHYAHALDALARLPNNDENRRRRMDTLVKQVVFSRFADAPTRNLARLDEAESIAKRLLESDPSVRRQLAEIYHWKGFVNFVRNETREALGYYNESRALAQALGDDQLVAQISVHAAVVLNFQGRFAEAEPVFRESINLMRKVGIPIEDPYTLGQLGWSLASQGLYVEGLAEAQRGLTIAQQTNHPGALAPCYSVLIHIYRMGNDIPQMLKTSRALLEIAEAAHDQVFVYSSAVFIAWAQSYLGQQQAAFESMARAKAIIQMPKQQVVLRELYAASEAEIVFNAGRIKEAQALAEQAVSLARSVDSIFAEGLARRVWAQALAVQNPPRWDETETHLAESLRLFESGNARLEAARTHIAWGKILKARGNRDAAREYLEKAAVQFEASGLTRELDEARALLSA